MSDNEYNPNQEFEAAVENPVQELAFLLCCAARKAGGQIILTEEDRLTMPKSGRSEILLDDQGNLYIQFVQDEIQGESNVTLQ